MTFDEFKDAYQEKTPIEKLRLMVDQFDNWRNDAKNRVDANWRGNFDEAAYYASECEAMKERVVWLYAEISNVLKAQEPVSIEERLVLDKLHTIQDYARVNEIHWMADGAAFAENVMNMLRGEINQFRKAQLLGLAPVPIIHSDCGATNEADARRMLGIDPEEDRLTMNDNDLISRKYVLQEYDCQHQGPPGGARKIMEEAPTIDAIPVEWLRDWQDEVGTLNEWWPIIQRIITVWQEEQEVDK